MEVLEAIETRQSCRAYAPKPVEKEKLLRILEAASLAPSACNSQPWSITVAEQPETVAKTAEAIMHSGINKFAPQVPVFLALVEEPARLIGSREPNQKFAQGDIGILAAHLCLAARDQGLSTCILGGFVEEEIKQVLQSPAERTVRLLIAVGYAAEDAVLRPKKRKSLDDFVRFL